MTLAFEALAWGRHVNRLAQAWDAVRRADHPAVTVAVDTFHMLARGDAGEALAGIPGDRIGFLQVADAPVLDMNVLEWSRHHRCFPGQGMLDVTGVVAATLEAGYRGPLSLEVFSDVVREADPAVTARDAHRSLVFLEDQVASVVRRGAGELVRSVPPAAVQTDPAFVEVADPFGSTTDLLVGLGFVRAGRHRTKPVTWWRNGGAHVVVNAAPPAADAHAVGVLTPDVASLAARAAALDWPAVDRTRGDGEARLPGITSPSGLHVFVSAPAGTEDHWQGDFDPEAVLEVGTDAGRGGWTALDHVGVAVPPDRLNEEIAFFRTLFGLAPSPVEEFIEPHGRLLSRALRPPRGTSGWWSTSRTSGPGDRRARGSPRSPSPATTCSVACVSSVVGACR